MGFMDGKRGLVFGIANDRSYAWFITKQIMEQGAECAFTYMPVGKVQMRVTKAVEELGVKDAWIEPCDVSSDESIDELFAKVKKDFGKIDFIVHSVAFADRQYLQLGNFHETPRGVFNQALDVSVYSLVALMQRAAPLMPDGGAVISMSYYGGEKVIPGYNVMGIAKSALEHTTRYLAAELGRRNIRVNCISGGPLRTLAASAVGGLEAIFELTEQKSPLHRNIQGEEVGNTAAFLLSDLSSGVTGEIIYVDSGFNIIGV